MYPHPPSSHNFQRGFSLVEILLVLGIASVLAIGAFLVYPKVQMSRQIEDTSSRVALIGSSLKQFFGNKRPPANLSNATAIAAGIVSQEDLSYHWGVIQLEDSPTGESGYKLTFNGLDGDVCKKLMSHIEPRVYAIALQGNFVKSKLVTYDALGAPAQCAASGNQIQVWPKL